MSRNTSVRNSLAASAVLALVATGVGVAPSFADPGKGNGGASSSAPGHTKHDKKDKKDKGEKGNKGNGNGHANGNQGKGPKDGKGPKGNNGGNGNGQGTGPATGEGAGQDNAGGAGDPAGNNGTVKIAGLGELDGIPNNTPHPGCTFQVEWYGFDEGDDIISQVSFAMHAPTSDVALSVAGDTSVFVGGDPASGAGTATGLDGVETYTLTFDGEPHPKQGYHLKLTVATPRSNGNDTKTKVFWVEPCATAPADETGEESTDEESTGEESTDEGVLSSEDGLEGETETGVLGTSSEVSQNELESSAADSDEVPTRIDAGEEGTFSSFGGFVSSPLGLLVAGLGILLAAAGVLARRRSGVSPTS